MASLIQPGKYGAVNTTDTSKMGYYVIKFVSEAYTLQEDTTCYIQIMPAGELFFKAQYLSFMKEKTNWYWGQKNQQQIITYPTWTIVHPCIDVVEVKYVHDIPKVFAIETTKNRQKKSYMSDWLWSWLYPLINLT